MQRQGGAAVVSAVDGRSRAGSMRTADGSYDKGRHNRHVRASHRRLAVLTGIASLTAENQETRRQFLPLVSTPRRWIA
jgi:hypothetical protein